MFWRLAAAPSLVFLVACTGKPGAEDVRSALQEKIPDIYREVVVLQPPATDMRTEGDWVLVTFKAQLKLNEPLYTQSAFPRAAESAGVDPAKFASAERVLQSVPSNLRQQFDSDIQRLLKRPSFVEEATPAGAVADWYGSYRAKKVVDKWIVGEFHTDMEPSLKGLRRSSFPADAVPLQQASQWFNEAHRDFEGLVQRMSDAQKVQDAEALAARAQVAAQEATHQARELPVNAQFRRAVIGGTTVLRLQVAKPITVTVNVNRGQQHFTRDLQLVPGRTTEFGHLEGWGFRGGDRVTLTNSEFNPLEFTAP